MNRLFCVAAATVLLALICAPQLQAATILYDDFEEADLAGTYMPDAPPIGENWTDYYPGSTQHNIADNPSVDTVNPSDLAFYMQRSTSQGSAIIQAPISVADQALIAANGRMTVEMKFYNVDMTDGKGVYLAGIGSVSGSLSPWAFEPLWMGDGTVQVQAYDGEYYLVDTGLTFTHDAWHTTKMVVDFATDTFDLWVDGVTTANAQDLPFRDPSVDFTTVGRVIIGTVSKPAAYYIDDVVISSIPEPSSWILLTIGTLVLVTSRWRLRSLGR